MNRKLEFENSSFFSFGELNRCRRCLTMQYSKRNKSNHQAIQARDTFECGGVSASVFCAN